MNYLKNKIKLFQQKKTVENKRPNIKLKKKSRKC